MKTVLLLTLSAAALLASPAAAKPDYTGAIEADYDKSLGALWDHFHRNPELSFREYKTAERMAQELRAVPGMEVTEKVGGTGVVGMLKNGKGPVILLRADMDGLPVAERSGLPNASTARQVGVDNLEMPVMHACGHDVHITSMGGNCAAIGAAKRSLERNGFVYRPARRRTRRRGRCDGQGRAIHAVPETELCAGISCCR
jgi:metal-dependent amidase/aminoacylase/carboxypeptidase family protein